MTILPLAFTTRRADPSDVPEVCDLGSSVFSTAFGHSVPPDALQAYLSESYTPKAIAGDISDPSKSTIIASDKIGTVVGFAMLTRGTSDPCVDHLGGKVELQRVYVDSQFHGQGIGKLLMDELEKIAKKEGFEHIWLGVWEENLKAQKVYEKLGYERLGEHDFAVGSVVQRDHIMVKVL